MLPDALLLLPLLASQEAPPEIEACRETFRQIVREALARGEAYAKLERLCAAAPRRLSGSPGAATAAEWAKEAMKRDGLENIRLEPVTVPRWERGEIAEFRILAPPEAAEESLPVLALGGSVGTPPEGIEAPIVEVKSFEELRALGDRAKGRIVFFNRPMEPGNPDPFEAYGGAVDQRGRGAVEAARAGAAAALVRSMTTAIDDFPHTGGMHYEDGVAKVPAAAVSTRGAERLSARLREGREFRARLRLDCREAGEASGHNVIGEWSGRERPSEVVLVGGHLDAWDVGQGAHDDGAGCCQAIEAARILRALDLRPRRTIRVVLFANEENGLRGARAYRAAHEKELPDHVLALESDRGGFAPRGFTTNAGTRSLAILRGFGRLLEGAGADEVRPGEGGADVSVLERDGVVLAGLLPEPQRYFDFHHSARDTIETVHPRELNLGAGAIAALLYGVADLPERLPRNEAPRRP
ncbi:MAG TPA: M20/M25/M40 family metallo-hydrolase [Planctomycetota bacterium]|jgi:hypothetical protein|nr:M20/M25/M40 family metallo-hydrolase [Planctomycetota bacterium]